MVYTEHLLFFQETGILAHATQKMPMQLAPNKNSAQNLSASSVYNISHMLQLTAGRNKPILCDSTGKRLLEAWPGFLWTLAHTLFLGDGSAPFSFAVMIHCHNMTTCWVLWVKLLNHSNSGGSLRLGNPWPTTEISYFCFSFNKRPCGLFLNTGIPWGSNLSPLL